MEAALVGVPNHRRDREDQQRRTDDGAPEPHPRPVDADEPQTEDAMAGASLEGGQEDDLDRGEDREDRERVPAEEAGDQIRRAVIDEERTHPPTRTTDGSGALPGQSEAFARVVLSALRHFLSVPRSS
ncbi:hypothetical protein D3C87_1798020 [compost metagenome]